jgi:hypothetical protein
MKKSQNFQYQIFLKKNHDHNSYHDYFSKNNGGKFSYMK